MKNIDIHTVYILLERTTLIEAYLNKHKNIIPLQFSDSEVCFVSIIIYILHDAWRHQLLYFMKQQDGLNLL